MLTDKTWLNVEYDQGMHALMLGRVFIPSAMLFTTNFKIYICFLFPLLCISHLIVI